MDLRGDFVIVGSGIAGLRAAVELPPAGDIVIITKADPSESNTEYAQGGIAAAIGADDSPALHAADTEAAGDGLCDERAVRVLTEEGPRYTLELLEWGARFDLDAHGRPALASEGAHSVRRVLHASDATGREIGRVLWERTSAMTRIRVLKNTLATQAVIEDGCCAGVRFIDEQGRPGQVRSRATLLATGGAGQVFHETTNPAIATGDGVALAFRAGARVADMEFVQFHPTVLDVEGAPRFLLSEALRGEGARLVNAAGEAFMVNYHPSGDLAPRDVVARSIVRESKRTGGGVFLSMQHLDPGQVRRRFPMIAATVLKAGLDLARDLIPVGPAAHYLMGGVETDLDGRTSIPGLFAAGEAACTRVHGANRLASNSLLEGLVFGARAGQAMAGSASTAKLPAPVFREASTSAATMPERRMPPLDEEDIRALMWKSVGLFRDRDSLLEAVDLLQSQQAALERRLADNPGMGHEAWRLASLITVAALIARSALRREESRGGHFRTDFPARDNVNWKIHVSDLMHRS
ncbi:MAG TPA: L-aspartate oxidase [Vicinamibacterales bacterium]|nr:L-aspartate oxidase [Vicinamibacterales bacterium]